MFLRLSRILKLKKDRYKFNFTKETQIDGYVEYKILLNMELKGVIRPLPGKLFEAI